MGWPPAGAIATACGESKGDKSSSTDCGFLFDGVGGLSSKSGVGLNLLRKELFSTVPKGHRHTTVKTVTSTK